MLAILVVSHVQQLNYPKTAKTTKGPNNSMAGSGAWSRPHLQITRYENLYWTNVLVLSRCPKWWRVLVLLIQSTAFPKWEAVVGPLGQGLRESPKKYKGNIFKGTGKSLKVRSCYCVDSKLGQESRTKAKFSIVFSCFAHQCNSASLFL